MHQAITGAIALLNQADGLPPREAVDLVLRAIDLLEDAVETVVGDGGSGDQP